MSKFISFLKWFASGFHPKHFLYRLSFGFFGKRSPSVVSRAINKVPLKRKDGKNFTDLAQSGYDHQGNIVKDLLHDTIRSKRIVKPFPSDLTPDKLALKSIPTELGACLLLFGIGMSIHKMILGLNEPLMFAWGFFLFLIFSTYYFNTIFLVFKSSVTLRCWQEKDTRKVTLNEFFLTIKHEPLILFPLFFNRRVLKELKR